MDNHTVELESNRITKSSNENKFVQIELDPPEKNENVNKKTENTFNKSYIGFVNVFPHISLFAISVIIFIIFSQINGCQTPINNRIGPNEFMLWLAVGSFVAEFIGFLLVIVIIRTSDYVSKKVFKLFYKALTIIVVIMTTIWLLVGIYIIISDNNDQCFDQIFIPFIINYSCYIGLFIGMAISKCINYIYHMD